MNKYVNEMEDYLYNHNYISENNNNVKQQELSVERASCIVQKYRTLTEEKDKEIERLTAESTEWESKYYDMQDNFHNANEEIERLKAREEECMNAYLRARQNVSEYEGKYVVAKYVIDKLEKYLEEEQIRLARENSNIYEDSLGKTRLVNDDIFNEITRIKDKLKILKEGDDND